MTKELLALLPKGKARLSVETLKFTESNSFWDLPCSKTLAIKGCDVNTGMGLSAAVNLNSLSILQDVMVIRKDLEEILATLSKLEHLCIGIWRIKSPESSASTAFVQRLQESLPLFTSLELQSLSEYSEGGMAARGQLARLTSVPEPWKIICHPIGERRYACSAPQALRHRTTLKALKHLSLNI